MAIARHNLPDYTASSIVMNDIYFIDGHAHWHDSLSLITFLDKARLNFRHTGSLFLSADANLQAFLCLADFVRADGWKRLKNLGPHSKNGPWTLTACDEQAMLATHKAGDRLWVIAGRQIVTAEKIEVMALGTVETVSNGLSLHESLYLLKKLDALPVLPWGVGKWWGKRGRIVREVMQQSQVLLGDNGGRPWCWRPNLLSHAHRLGISVLPGSDPLPTENDRVRNGAFGVVVKGTLSPTSPTDWLKKKLTAQPFDSPTFGGPLDLCQFITNQLALRNKGKIT